MELISFPAQFIPSQSVQKVGLEMISKVRQLREYFVQIQTDEAEIDHFWFFHGGKMMS